MFPGCKCLCHQTLNLGIYHRHITAFPASVGHQTWIFFYRHVTASSANHCLKPTSRVQFWRTFTVFPQMFGPPSFGVFHGTLQCFQAEFLTQNLPSVSGTRHQTLCISTDTMQHFPAVLKAPNPILLPTFYRHIAALSADHCLKPTTLVLLVNFNVLPQLFGCKPVCLAAYCGISQLLFLGTESGRFY